MKKKCIGKYYKNYRECIFRVDKVNKERRYYHKTGERVAHITILSRGEYRISQLRSKQIVRLDWVLNDCTEVSRIKAELLKGII